MFCSVKDSDVEKKESNFKDFSLIEFRNVNEVDENGNEYAFGRCYTFPYTRLKKFKNIINSANSRLRKAGIRERFTYSIEDIDSVRSDNGVLKIYTMECKAILNVPVISFSGYKFLGVCEADHDSMILRTATGANLGDFRPGSMFCEYCGKNRYRTKIFLIQDSSGNIHKVGSNCVELFLGFKPAGLWALSFDAKKVNDDFSDFMYIGENQVNKNDEFRTRDVIAFGLALSDNGKNFITQSKAKNFGILSTSDEFFNVVYGKNNRDKLREYITAKEKFLTDGSVDKVYEIAKKLEDNTYGLNVKTLMGSEYVSTKSIPMVLSVIAVYFKNMENKASNNFSKGFAGDVKDSVKGISAVVSDIKYFDSYDYYGNPITRTMILFRDQSNHAIVWWSSKEINEIGVGDNVRFSSGFIKKHSNYRRVDQTIVTRLKFRKF